MNMPTMEHCAFDVNDSFQRSLKDLLVTGSDSRLIIEEQAGRNKYHCANTPLPDVTPFGSCTSSTITQGGFEVAREMYDQFRSIDDPSLLREAVDEFFENARRELLALFTGYRLTGSEIVFASSGTDAELMALWLAMGADDKHVVNIVVGPTEVGSGTVKAASGLFFDEYCPRGHLCESGSPVDADICARTSVETIGIRDENGQVRQPSAIDEEVTKLAKKSIAAGSNVLLHVIAHSKTGVHAPSLQCVEDLRKSYPKEVSIVVDAAQGRFSRRGFTTALRLGYMALITGSKFFGGPPFSGGLVVPESMLNNGRHRRPLPAGFQAFFTRSDIPKAWEVARNSVPDTANAGLALRWCVALHEIRRYYATPSTLRLKILRAFENYVPQVFSHADFVELIPPGEPVLRDEEERFLQSKTTVFSFKVKRTPGSDQYYTKGELANIFRWLNYDISSLLPDVDPETRRDVAPKHHIGQPVMIGDSEDQSVLRVAIGGVLISTIATDQNVGQNLDERLNWLEDRLISLKRKIEVLGRNYDKIRDAENACVADQ